MTHNLEEIGKALMLNVALGIIERETTRGAKTLEEAIAVANTALSSFENLNKQIVKMRAEKGAVTLI